MNAGIDGVARRLDIAGAVLVGATTLIGLALFARHNVPDPSIWYDESGQFWLSQGLHHDSLIDAQPGSVLDGVWYGRNGFNLDPPGFTILLAGWVKAFGSHVVSLRLLPFLLFCMTFVPAYLIGTRALRISRTLSVLLPALVLTVALPLQYSTEIRAYSAELLAVVLTAWAGLRAYQDPSGRTRTILCLAMLFGATSTRYSYLVAATAVIVLVAAAMLVGPTGSRRWRELSWPGVTYLFIGLFTAWSVGLFGGGRQYDYGRGYSDGGELRAISDWAGIQERLVQNLWRGEHQATGLFLVAGLVLGVVLLILRMRSVSQPAPRSASGTAGGVLLLWGFVLSYEVSAVAFSYAGIVPWLAGDRWSIGLEAVAVLSWLGLAGLATLVLRPLWSGTVKARWQSIVGGARWVALAAFFVLAGLLTISVVNRLVDYVHSDFRVASSKLPAIIEQAIPPGVQVDWLVDYWSWPTFKYVVKGSGTFPADVAVTTATPVRLTPEADGLDVLASQPRCGPDLATAILHEDWSTDYATRNAKFAAKASQLRCVSTVYPLSNSESLVVLTAPGAIR